MAAPSQFEGSTSRIAAPSRFRSGVTSRTAAQYQFGEGGVQTKQPKHLSFGRGGTSQTATSSQLCGGRYESDSRTISTRGSTSRTAAPSQLGEVRVGQPHHLNYGKYESDGRTISTRGGTSRTAAPSPLGETGIVNYIFSVFCIFLPPVECGKPQVASRIMGGQNAQPGQWPWQVSLRNSGRHFCGGSLISESWVVSAAHCITSTVTESTLTVHTVTESTLTVHLGCFQIASPNSHEISVGVKTIMVNPLYTSVGSLGDISLIQLKTPVNYTAYILPVCLPTADVSFPMGLYCWVTGWGNIKSGLSLPSPQTLQEAQIPLIDTQTCDSLYHIESGVSNSVPIILSNMICGGYKAGGTDSCQGDSGGPLVCSQGGQWFLAGLVSWGDGCGKLNRPGVYTRLTAYQDWIKNNANGTEKNMVNVTFTGQVNQDAYLSRSGSSRSTPIFSRIWTILYIGFVICLRPVL
ncbi:serine protease 27-like [Mantella aurantiaca]